MNKPKKILSEVYETIEMQDLIVFSIYSVIRKKETCTYERLVAESYTQFPKVFSFKRYPQWPDALKFDRPLRTLRNKGLIVGTVRDHFELTEFGRAKAKEIEGFLKGRKAATAHRKSRPIGRSLHDKLIGYIKESPSFNRYLKDPQKFFDL